jgi:putative radical SAM enzyme (TIGR03279 family)
VGHVEPGSIAHELGLEPGDEVVSINGHALRDVIDYRFYGAEEDLDMLVRRGGEEVLFQIERDLDQALGIDFVQPTFDGIRRCANNCSFCFVKGMPPGLRPSLYVKDDDYRHSFLFGNYVTLTNLSSADWSRIREQRLSPLFVSVHATDADLRRRLLGNPGAPDLMPQLHRLRDMGIEVHTQIVLIPGENDGPHLRRTVADLAGLWPSVRSVGIVPVGLTRFQAGCGRVYRPEEAAPILDLVQEWQVAHRPRFGVNWVYASDEWYLLSHRTVPPAAGYDGFPQLENGIGLVRTLLDDWEEARRGRPSVPGHPVTLVCGTLIAPLLASLAEELSALLSARARVLPVVNDFFGSEVTVSGLLSGLDVRRALERERPDGLVFLPRAMFDSEGVHTLDDLSLPALQADLDARLSLGSTLGDVVGIAGAASERARL